MKFKLTHIAAAALAACSVPAAAQSTTDTSGMQEERDDFDFPWGLLGLLGLAGLMGRKKDDRNDNRGTSSSNR